MVQFQEIVGLHDHVVEFKESQSFFHSLFIAFSCQHPVNRKMYADFPQEFYIIQVQQPVCIICKDHLPFGVIQKMTDLLPEPFHIMVDCLFRHHLTHVTLSGRISDHGRSAAHQCDRNMAGSLHMHHRHDGKKMSGSQRICGRVKSDVEFYFFSAKKIPQLFRMGTLRDKSSFC